VETGLGPEENHQEMFKKMFKEIFKEMFKEVETGLGPEKNHPKVGGASSGLRVLSVVWKLLELSGCHLELLKCQSEGQIETRGSP
jgi:hypothetical protein